MSIFAFLWFWLFTGSFAATKTKNDVKNLAILPIRPVMIGLLVGVIFLIPVFPGMIVLVAKGLLTVPSITDFGVYALLMSAFGLISYWAPVAYLVRKFSGDKITVSWL